MKNKIVFQDMTDAELDSRIAEFKKEKFNYRAQAKAGQIENPAKFKELRRKTQRAGGRRRSPRGQLKPTNERISKP